MSIFGALCESPIHPQVVARRRRGTTADGGRGTAKRLSGVRRGARPDKKYTRGDERAGCPVVRRAQRNLRPGAGTHHEPARQSPAALHRLRLVRPHLSLPSTTNRPGLSHTGASWLDEKDARAGAALRSCGGGNANLRVGSAVVRSATCVRAGESVSPRNERDRMWMWCGGGGGRKFRRVASPLTPVVQEMRGPPRGAALRRSQGVGCDGTPSGLGFCRPLLSAGRQLPLPVCLLLTSHGTTSGRAFDSAPAAPGPVLCSLIRYD